MRLLNTATLQLEGPFFDESLRPEYAILSHTWGDGEVLYEDVRGLPPNSLTARVRKAGSAKVVAACALARREDYQYIWIDTCCIDKSSSAELSEAINSMFKWYQGSKVCFAFLADVNFDVGADDEFEQSRWFSRGWTLQELIGPRSLVFFDKSWARIGSRGAMAGRIAAITKIEVGFLKQSGDTSLQERLSSATVATRMTWAAARTTSRPEDMAYCLMGLFDVHMPLLYGEGGSRAFFRLQREIVQRCNDATILAWIPPIDRKSSFALPRSTVFTDSPGSHFLADTSRFPDPYRSGLQQMVVVNKGLQLDVLIGSFACSKHVAVLGAFSSTRPLYVAMLSCGRIGYFHSRLAIVLERVTPDNDKEYRKVTSLRALLWLDRDASSGATIASPAAFKSNDEAFSPTIGTLSHANILLLDNTRAAEARNLFTPPLRVRVQGSASRSASIVARPTAPDYQLVASTLPATGNYIAHSSHPIGDLREGSDFVQSTDGIDFLAGVLLFRRTDLPTNDFFVLLGFRLPDEAKHHWAPVLGRCWWDYADLFCLALPWHRLMEADGDHIKVARKWADADAFKSAVKRALRGHNHASGSTSLRNHGSTLQRFFASMSNESRIAIGGDKIRVFTNAVDFLGRRSFELNVEEV